jgi:transglutaminase-like putative cysteine protease
LSTLFRLSTRQARAFQDLPPSVCKAVAHLAALQKAVGRARHWAYPPPVTDIFPIAEPKAVIVAAVEEGRGSGPDAVEQTRPVPPRAEMRRQMDAYRDLGSRYCDTEKLAEVAWNLFGHTPMGWGRVQAICDFVHNHISFGYEHARATRTAFEAYNERRGVCRDYAHLAVAFCRCMNIPARYCTGYLGDIGMAPPYGPMDFAAWFEAYIGGRWYTFDARNNMPRIGRVLMARGRDAIDVAIATTFGPNTLVSFKVWTDEMPG